MNVNILKGKIVEKGFTQRTLAKKMKMSTNTLNEKLNGKRPFNTDEVRDLCDLLGITNSAEKVDIFLSRPSQN
jgi:transcriptional regulator with XRE-family HTH domain